MILILSLMKFRVTGRDWINCAVGFSTNRSLCRSSVVPHKILVIVQTLTIPDDDPNLPEQAVLSRNNNAL